MALRDAWHWMRELTGHARAERWRIARDDPWRRLELEPPLNLYGPGASHDFRTFLERESRVRAASPREVATWLLGCRYADDALLLGEVDAWQHPCTFEILRTGDCEDFALWGWRKLVEARYHAEFVVGMRHHGEGKAGRHAWVVFREGDREFILDGVERSLDRMVCEVALAHAAYEPQVGVGPDGTRFVFAGLYRAEWGRRLVLPRRKR